MVLPHFGHSSCLLYKELYCVKKYQSVQDNMQKYTKVKQKQIVIHKEACAFNLGV